MAADSKKVKILVLGNTGVGKSSLVHLMCHDEVLSHPTWTVGCTVEVKLHSYTPSLHTPGNNSDYFLEFWDVGGAPYHKKGRPVFYQNVNGLVLVHDLTNRKSHSHLSKWLAEFHNGRNRGAGSLPMTTTSIKKSNVSHDTFSNFDYDPEQFVDQEVPLLIVGTKQDQALTSGRGSSSVTGAAAIKVDCRNPHQFAVHSPQRIELNKFFDKVIEHRFFPDTIATTLPGGGGGGGRERFHPLVQRTLSSTTTACNHNFHLNSN